MKRIGKPDWHVGVHIELFAKEYELWKEKDGVWHGDAIKYGEWTDISDEEALRIAVRNGLEPPRVIVNRHLFRKKVKELSGLKMKQLAEGLGYGCFRQFARQYEKGWCSMDFAMRVCSALSSDICTVFGQYQPWLHFMIPNENVRFYEAWFETENK